jgi:hypothetical protein
MWLFDKGLKVRPQFNFPPGYISEGSLRGVLMSGILTRPRPTLQDQIDNGVVIVGDVGEVIEKLTYYTDELHAGMLVTGGHVGELPEELVIEGQDIMAKQVMPHFRRQAATPAPSTAQSQSRA